MTASVTLIIGHAGVLQVPQMGSFTWYALGSLLRPPREQLPIWQPRQYQRLVGTPVGEVQTEGLFSLAHCVP